MIRKVLKWEEKNKKGNVKKIKKNGLDLNSTVHITWIEIIKDFI